MSGLWYKRNPQDYLSGTRKLTLEERGLYSTLLEMMYAEGGMIAGDDPAYLARECGCSTRKFNALLSRLIEVDKIILIDGYLTNKRVLSTLKPEFMSRLSRDKREIMKSECNENKALRPHKKLKKLKNPPNPPIQKPKTQDEKPKPPSLEKIAHSEAWAEFRSALNAAAGGAASRPQVDGRALIDVCREVDLPPRTVLAALLAFYRSPAIAKQEEMYRPGFSKALHQKRFEAFLDKPAEAKPAAPQYESPLEMNKRLEREAREKRERKAA